MSTRSLAGAAFAAALQLLAGCGGGDAGIGIATGTMRVSLTDAPACGYDAVNVTVERVRVHVSDGAGDADGGWHEIVPNPPQRIDLLSLGNGVLRELGQVSLPAGRYSQLRLVLAANGGATPLANSVVPSGAAETALATPSAQQSGLKLKAQLDVPAGQVADFVIDFDACRSVVRRGNSGRYNLKPVLAVVPLLSGAGLRVQGDVAPSIALPSTRVSLQLAGVPVKATVPDVHGRFVLYPLPVGSYDLVVSADGRASAIITGVPVVEASATIVNTPAVPIDPPPSTVRAVAGTVTPTDASVRALQRLSGGPTFEAAWAGVDDLSGAFGFTLPVAAPVRTSFAGIGPFSLNFVADTAAAGRYTVEATALGLTQAQVIDVNAPVPALSFVFP